MNNEETLFEIRKEAERYRIFSEKFLRRSTEPEILHCLNDWLPHRRLIDPAIFINKFLCLLEEKSFRRRELEISIYAGSVAAVSDDLIDKYGFELLDRIALFTPSKDNVCLEEICLFDFFNKKLKEKLPRDFIEKFREAIYEYNQVQKETSRLFDTSLTPQELIDIKNRAGGYSVLLLYAMLFPNTEKLIIPPSSISLALYNFGAWLSMVDDLWDETKDRICGMKQLATEKIVTWESIQEETSKILADLKIFYPYKTVDAAFNRYYLPLVNRDMAMKYNK